MYQQFLKDLKNAEPFELEAIKKIEQLNNVKLKMRCDNKDYDFMTDDDKTYEVKNDMMSSKTNNFFIEFISFGKKSGIETTKADSHILIYNKINYYLIKTDDLKLLIFNNEVKFQKRSSNDKTSIGYLVPVKLIIELSTLI